MIMVAGSTGVLGFEICRRLRARGQSVRVLVRATSAREKVRALEAIGCDTVVGDLKDRRSLDAACAGADVVIVETAVQCVGHPAARNAVISFGGPEALSQRDAVRIFEEAFGKPFTDRCPEEALEAQWKSAGDPFTRSFSALMPGAARGDLVGEPLPADQFPMRMTTVREFAASLVARAN
jgi:uncharacterized protein YbjT (DUF2867 family)